MESTDQILRRLRQRSPAGFAIALHVEFTTPRYLFQGYDKEWLDHYSSKGLVMHDPTVRWGFEHTGSVRWSDLAADDPMAVLSQAAEYGLRFGLTVAVNTNGTRSISSFARRDREMSDLDIAAISADVAALHKITVNPAAFTPATHEAMRQLSIYLTHS